MIITPTDKQSKAIKDIIAWYTGNEFNGKDPNRIFTLSGLAGSGKSSVVKLFIEELGLTNNEVAFAAYTGMAANVLLQKGNTGATTIHKLIYDTVPIKNEETGEIEKFIHQLKEELDRKEIKLIVIDEVSMVNESMLEQLKTFGVKIIAIGDPGL
ncbi:hypothetical protein Bp8pS_065 [Bacillus phage vB_BpuM-BpSp]|nr:hypothetical protein Bp8pS_065 [Bacillus phage vB_BpuM-BpSp]